MKQVVCSGFSPQGRIDYGERFLATFDRHWPASVGLKVYVEEPFDMPRGACRDLFDCRGVSEFLADTKDDPVANGKRPHGKGPADPRPDVWREKEWTSGYTFRLDARKFSRQLFIPENAAEDMDDGDILTWLDGDVVTTRDVSDGFVPGLLGGADGAYLGRMGQHSEIGFWCVRLSPGTRSFLTALADMYRSGEVFHLRETHSAFVWDTVRGWLPGLHFRNLTPKGNGHVWPTSPLGSWMRHDKGQRKYK